MCKAESSGYSHQAGKRIHLHLFHDLTAIRLHDELISRVFEGKPEGLTRDDILDNITITWLTNTALSGARLYLENWGKLGYFSAKGVSIPVAVSVFPGSDHCAIRVWPRLPK